MQRQEVKRSILFDGFTSQSLIFLDLYPAQYIYLPYYYSSSSSPRDFKLIKAGPHKPIPYPTDHLYYYDCSITKGVIPNCIQDNPNVNPPIPPPDTIIGKCLNLEIIINNINFN